MNIIKTLLHAFKLPDYIIEIGVVSEKTKRKETVKVGLTNAEIMFINENGSPLNHIPARPVLEMTLQWVSSSGLLEKTIDKCLDVYLKTDNLDDVDKEVNKLCLRMQNYARRIIYDNDGRLAPNAPSTIRKKGENYPLHDTGQLARSITCRAIRIDKEEKSND